MINMKAKKLSGDIATLKRKSCHKKNINHKVDCSPGKIKRNEINFLQKNRKIQATPKPTNIAQRSCSIDGSRSSNAG